MTQRQLSAGLVLLLCALPAGARAQAAAAEYIQLIRQAKALYDDLCVAEADAARLDNARTCCQTVLSYLEKAEGAAQPAIEPIWASYLVTFRGTVRDALTRLPASPGGSGGSVGGGGSSTTVTSLPAALQDADRDGIPDRLDACPAEPGMPAGRGCPERKYVVVSAEKVEIHQKLQFAPQQAKVLPPSSPVLDEVAGALKAYPEMKLRIEGHTDAQGDMAQNLHLSRQRAQAVREQLIRRGIDPERLTAEGYGGTRPLTENKTGEGRQRNRRVEFTITQAAGKAPAPPVQPEPRRPRPGGVVLPAGPRLPG